MKTVRKVFTVLCVALFSAALLGLTGIAHDITTGSDPLGLSLYWLPEIVALHMIALGLGAIAVPVVIRKLMKAWRRAKARVDHYLTRG